MTEYIFLCLHLPFVISRPFSCSFAFDPYDTYSLFYFTNVSFNDHVETSWDVVGGLYANTAEYTGCKRSLSGDGWLPWRTYLQGNLIYSNFVNH